uniref:Nicastrin n=1 Tax=Myxobolus squamalis TaxID=59785 RepID=A0A6B2G1Z1_MYXSQ
MLSLLFLIFSAKLFLINLSFQSYKNIDNEINPCISYSSHSNNIGCSSKFQGSSGEIYFIKNEDDIQNFLSFQSNSKYIIVIHADVLSIKNIENLEKTRKIAGIVVLVIKGKRPETQSYENTCLDQPNDYYSSHAEYKQCKNNSWNPHGQNMMERSYSYPMIIIKNQANIDLITSCYENKNAKNLYPKCGISMNILMNSFSMTTPECIRKDEHYFGLNENRFCFNLAAQNIYVPFLSNKTSNRYLVVSTKLDTRCLFSEACLGANSELTSIMVFLSMIHTLSKFKKEIQNNSTKNILFIGFDGVLDFVT